MRQEKTNYIPTSFKEKKYLCSVDSMTIATLHKTICETINRIADPSLKFQFSEKYENHLALKDGKKLASYKHLLVHLRETLNC